jgi:hypothetical protein
LVVGAERFLISEVDSDAVPNCPFR